MNASYMTISLRKLTLILLLAFALRISGAHTNTLSVLQDDHLDYHRIAENLLNGKGYVQVEGFAYGRQPGWPYLLAGVYALGGVHPEIGVWVTALLGMLTVGAAWRVGRLMGGDGVGLLAAFFLTVDPFLIVQDQTLLSESLYTFGLTLALWLLLRRRAAAFGLLTGLLTLVRSNGIGLIIGMLWLPRKRIAQTLIITALILLPWTIRNLTVAGSFSPLAPQSGQLLLGSYNNFTLNSPDAYGMWLFPRELPEGAPYADLPYLQRERAWADAAFQFISQHLTSIPVMIGRRLARFALQPAYVPRPALDSRLLLFQPIYFFFLLISTFEGIVILALRRVWRPLLIMGTLLLPTLIIVAVLYGEARFRTPYHPMMACLSAAFYAWLGSALRRKRKRRSRSHLAGLAS